MNKSGVVFRNGIPYGAQPDVESTPTQNSQNPVQSGGVYTALLGKSSVVISANGDITIDGQLVRKVLTQAEYDLLDPPDEKVDYKIVAAI